MANRINPTGNPSRGASRHTGPSESGARSEERTLYRGRDRYELDDDFERYGQSDFGQRNAGEDEWYGSSGTAARDWGNRRYGSGDQVVRKDWTQTRGGGEWYSDRENASSLGEAYNRGSSEAYEAVYGGEYERGETRDGRYVRSRQPEHSRSSYARREYDGGSFQGDDERGPQSYRAQSYRHPTYQDQFYRGQSHSDQSERGRSYRDQSYRGKGPKGYMRSDERTREVICELLTDAHDIDASEISVEVKNGEVTLTGTVGDRSTKHAAENLIERCTGAAEIHNNLRIQSQSRNQTGVEQEKGLLKNAADRANEKTSDRVAKSS